MNFFILTFSRNFRAYSIIILIVGVAIFLFKYDHDQFDNSKRIQLVEDMWGKKNCFRYKLSQNIKYFIDNDCFKPQFPGRPVVFLIGDSHSASLSLGLIPLAQQLKLNFHQVSTGWCEPTNDDPGNIVCAEINRVTLDYIKLLKPDLLILNVHWAGVSPQLWYRGKETYWDRLNSKLSIYLASNVREVLIVGQMPMWEPYLPIQLKEKFTDNDLPVPNRLGGGIKSDSLIIDQVMQKLSFPKGVSYLSLKEFLCNDSGCITSVGPDPVRDLIVWDDGHLTVNGAKFVVDYTLSEKLKKLSGIL